MAEHDHHHHGAGDDGPYGIAIGFRIFEDAGELFLAEAEITPYVDEPTALGATIVFHPLSELDPTGNDEELDWPAWPTDYDEELTRNSGAPTAEQFRTIVRQLAALGEGELRDLLRRAREEADEEGEQA